MVFAAQSAAAKNGIMLPPDKSLIVRLHHAAHVTALQQERYSTIES